MVYRFQVHFLDSRGKSRYFKFVVDIHPYRHDYLDLKLETLAALRGTRQRRYQYSQREVFTELWNAWEAENKKLASQLPAEFPEKLLALKKKRIREFGFFTNPSLLLELWDAWRRRNPKEAAKIERHVKSILKESRSA
jgi:ABC-type amino acid transport substrate-binding protein